MESYRGSDFRSDRDLLVSLLQHARSDALNSVCRDASCTDAAPHGVHITSTAYTVFEGGSYVAGAAQNQVFEASPAVTPSGLTDVVFEPATGDVLVPNVTPGTISLMGNGHTSDITIDSEGQISWTN